jgi:hypothetical protein
MSTVQQKVPSSSLKINWEKQESLVKLGILVLAAILCEFLHIFGCLIDFHEFFIISLIAFSTRLFSVLRFESVIHEFDPYFNYRTTKFLTDKGFYNFHNW